MSVRPAVLPARPSLWFNPSWTIRRVSRVPGNATSLTFSVPNHVISHFYRSPPIPRAPFNSNVVYMYTPIVVNRDIEPWDPDPSPTIIPRPSGPRCYFLFSFLCLPSSFPFSDVRRSPTPIVLTMESYTFALFYLSIYFIRDSSIPLCSSSPFGSFFAIWHF